MPIDWSSPAQKPAVQVYSSWQKTIYYKNEIPLVIDYANAMIHTPGRDIPFINDGIMTSDGERRPLSLVEMQNFGRVSPNDWILLSYDRFDVYIEQNYYNTNTASLTDFFDKFVPRYAMMEQQTGWSSEKFYGQKLVFYVEGTTGCSGGWSIPAESHLLLSDPFYVTGCQLPYINPVSHSLEFGNPGELGDYWSYMAVPLHESLHGINPLSILIRSWLTEGFSTYYQFNILSDYGDINKETSNYYIYDGISTWNWEDYVNNDYRDTTSNNYEIQNSQGYYITAWMFSMMRDDHSLDWSKFFSLYDKNDDDIVNYVFNNIVPADYYIDTMVADVFGKASGYPDLNSIKAVWRYDGPSGPGWGVRQWPSTTWYSDLTASLSVSNSTPFIGDSISVTATVFNTAAYNVLNVPVRFYLDSTIIADDTVFVPDSGSVVLNWNLSAAEGEHTLRVAVDYDDVKIELNDNNNQDSLTVTFAGVCGDADGSHSVDISDAVSLIQYIFQGGPAPVPLLSGDADCSGNVDISDAVYLIQYIFQGGPAPCAVC